MPEGPEIRRAADEIAAAITGQTTSAVFFAFDHLKQYEAILTGQPVTAVETRGKAILIRFAGGLNIYSHNQLYGRWVIRPAGDYPKTSRQLRLAIHTPRQSALLYSASDIEVLANDALATHPFLSRLGPDLLDPAVGVEQVLARLTDARFWRRRFTSLLLDQQFLAGMGNYLRSEVMFVARLHPALRPTDCSPEQLRRVAETALALTRQSYRTGGITNDLQRAEQLRREGRSREEYRFWVFRREGRPCYNCAARIVKEIIGGRRFYYCPSCQELP